MTTGLVLEGGAMRGMFTAGVLDAFLDHHIRADRVVGVSAGALFGVNYLSGQRGRVIRYNKRFNADRNYMGLRPLLREGNIVSTDYAYDRVPRLLDPFDDEAFQASGIPFDAVVTALSDGQPSYIRIHSVFQQMDVLRASGSMPFVSRPVELEGQLYLDGGIADSIPFRYLADQGCEKLVVVLTRPAGYRKKPMNSRFIRLWYRRYPQLVQTLEQRHIRYNEALDMLTQWERQGRALVIRPRQALAVGRLESDGEKLQAAYDQGRMAVEQRLEELTAYLT